MKNKTCGKAFAYLVCSIVFCLYSATIYAQCSNRQLTESYLIADMDAWEACLKMVDWEHGNAEDLKRALNCEYGYVAYRLGEKDSRGKQLISDFEQHIELCKHIISPSNYDVYKSSVNAYIYMLDNSKIFTAGLKSFKLANEAYQLDSLNPIALSLKANVDFYAPKAFGGNKKKALQLFLKAETLFRKMPVDERPWNYPATELCIAQCYEKTGDKAKAIKKCKEILTEFPNFLFIKNTYLPGLLTDNKK